MTYDTLKTSRALEAAGADRKLGEAIAEAIRGATVLPDTSALVTRDFLKGELASLKSSIYLTLGSGFVATVGILGSIIAFAHH